MFMASFMVNMRWHSVISMTSPCKIDDLRVFGATEGSTEHSPLVFGVETTLWPMASKKGGKWYRDVLEAAERSCSGDPRMRQH